MCRNLTKLLFSEDGTVKVSSKYQNLLFEDKSQQSLTALGSGCAFCTMYCMVKPLLRNNNNQQLLLGRPHRRENAVSDGGGLRDLDFEGLPIRIWS